jgi:4-amino-4-deoxy-L-arabinose transferase-like glycosyltransferase
MWAAILIGTVYGLVFGGMRLALSDNLTLDDATANVLAQTFALGYVERQPPLYEWLLWSVQQLTGPNLLSFLLIKYALLSATFAFLYLSATRIFSDWCWQVVAGVSPLLLFQIGWNLHEGVTQTMMLTCMVAASFWSFMRLAERGAVGDYLLFGLFIGLGLLSKYNFVGFLLILLMCALLQPALRTRLLNWRMLLAFAMAAVVTAPFAYWLISGRRDLVAVFDDAVSPRALGWLKARAIGLGLALYAPFGFLFPLVVILVVGFPRSVPQAWAALKQSVRPRDWERSTPDWPLLLLHMTIGGFLFLILGALLTGATHYLERYMHPFFLLTPLWLLALVERTGNAGRKVKVLAGLILVATVLVAPLRAYDLMKSMGPRCGKCRLAIPYEGLAEALRAGGFRSGTVIATNRDDAGNLRRLFPEARIVCLRNPHYAPPIRTTDRVSTGALVWRAAEGEKPPKGAAAELARTGAGLAGGSQEVRVPWAPFGAPTADRDWSWRVTFTAPSRARPQ